ncbi:MAG: DUF134 domain-containing protein [Bacteroidales bacterium]|nr:DUF134 domain-containing protein [Bacteroidales bacterium]
MDRPPLFEGFRPIGSKGRQAGIVYLELDEYESLRLCDYEGLTHVEASEVLQISRPTFTRIYSSARKKMAQALVDGFSLLIRGGKVDFDDMWLRCSDCTTVFNDVTRGENQVCPRCGSEKVSEVSTHRHKPTQARSSSDSPRPGFCICRNCGTRISHHRGMPCSQAICPNCESFMVKDGNSSGIFWAIPCFANEKTAHYNTRFARSPYFALFDGKDTVFFENPFPIEDKGLGQKIMETLALKGISGIVTGFLGDKAREVAESKGFYIENMDQSDLTVNDIINNLKSKFYEN